MQEVKHRGWNRKVLLSFIALLACVQSLTFKRLLQVQIRFPSVAIIRTDCVAFHCLVASHVITQKSFFAVPPITPLFVGFPKIFKGGSRGTSRRNSRLKIKSKKVLRSQEKRSTERRNLLDALRISGDSYQGLIRRTDSNMHPVSLAILKRMMEKSVPGKRNDKWKIGLAIEGGGMRGCVSSGMTASLMSLGLIDSFDAVYGSSAGSLIGAYAIAGQNGMPRVGCSVYYDALTSAGRNFIDIRFAPRAMGLGLFGAPLSGKEGMKDLLFDRIGSPVLKLDYLLNEVVRKLRPLDWDLFWAKQQVQPLNIVASGVYSQSSVVLSSSGGHFDSLEGLTNCMRASMLLPGIAGPMVQLPGIDQPLVDSQLYEPIPYRAALNDGCSHIVVLRSRPDGCAVSKPRLTERMIAKRFFSRKYKVPDVYSYMKLGGHKILYSSDMCFLNMAARASNGDRGPFVLPVSLPAGLSEIRRLELNREVIFNGVRQGFQYGHNILKMSALRDNPLAEMDGFEAARAVLPDCILDYNVDPILQELPEYNHIKVHLSARK